VVFFNFFDFLKDCHGSGAAFMGEYKEGREEKKQKVFDLTPYLISYLLTNTKMC